MLLHGSRTRDWPPDFDAVAVGLKTEVVMVIRPDLLLDKKRELFLKLRLLVIFKGLMMLE